MIAKLCVQKICMRVIVQEVVCSTRKFESSKNYEVLNLQLNFFKIIMLNYNLKL